MNRYKLSFLTRNKAINEKPGNKIIMWLMKKYPNLEANLNKETINLYNIEDIISIDILFNSLMDDTNLSQFPLDFYFYIIFRKLFIDRELEEKEIAFYISNLLIDFSNVEENAFNLKPTLMDDLPKLQALEGLDLIKGRLWLANKLLFITSFFPQYFKFRTERYGAPNLTFYKSASKQQYLLAKEHPIVKKINLENILNIINSKYNIIYETMVDCAENYLHINESFLHVPKLVLDTNYS